MIATPPQQTTQQTRTQTMLPLLALCLGYFMTILDVTIVNVALVNIKEQLSANVTGLQWIVDGYALVFASFLLTGGALATEEEAEPFF
jgi:MFS transporter, DHA2 family, methylenomycin A resistance protein